MTDELRTAVARREADADAPLPTVAAFGPPDQVRILQIIGLDPRDPRAHAVVAVAERYGLDPVLGHILILPKSNRPYITRDGYLHIAHRSGKFDGEEVTDGPRRDRTENEWTATVAIYRKDMSRPIAFPGRAGLSLENGPEMALARAERRSLKRAFDVTLPPVFAEDEWDDSRPLAVLRPAEAAQAVADASPPPPGPGAEPISDDARRAVLAGFRAIGVTGRDERRRRLRLVAEWTGHEAESLNDLTMREAADVLAHLQARRDQLREHASDEATGAGGTDSETVGEVDPGRRAGGPTRMPSVVAPDEGDPGDPVDPPASAAKRNEVIAALDRAGVPGKADKLELLAAWTGRPVASTGELSEAEADMVLRRVGAGDP